MKNRLPVMILTEPAGFEPHAHRLTLASGIAYKHFVQAAESFGKVREQFGGNFAFITSRAKNARHQNPSWSFDAHWGVHLNCEAEERSLRLRPRKTAA